MARRHRQETLDIVGHRVRARRVQLALSQEKLGTIMGYDAAYISRLENCKQGASVANLRRLAQVLNCTADFLLGLEEAPNPKPLSNIICPCCHERGHDLSRCGKWIVMNHRDR